MAFPNGSKGLVPWMNGRLDAGTNGKLPNNTVVSFPVPGNIVFKWIEDGTYPVTDTINLFANGRWGAGSADHYVLLRIVTALPGTTSNVVTDKSDLASLSKTVGNTTLVTFDNSYWEYVQTSGWVRLCAKVNSGTVSAYSVTATIYTVTVPIEDLPLVNNSPIKGTGYYDLCWDGNSLHSPRYDATFNISPPGHVIWTDYFDRTELNSRIAGEKALFPDECVTAGQIEAGQGAQIKWRKLDGSLPGYAADLTKAGNLVIEGNALQAAYANGGIYFNESSEFIQFRDSSTVKFNVFKESNKTIIKANVQELPLNNRIWTKHWWIAADAGNNPAFSTQPTQVVAGFNVNAGAISFSGHGFWDTTISPPLPVFLGTGEVVAEHSGIIDVATDPAGPGQIPPVLPTLVTPPNNALSPQAQYMFEGVKILRTGCYLVHTVIQGRSSPATALLDLPTHEHEMALHYFVKRGATYYNTYCLDHKSKIFQGYFDESPHPPYPGTYSNKWSLQGTAILALEENDLVFGQVAAISYVPIPGVGGFARNYTVNYITQHIEFLSERALTTNLYPHNNPWTVIQFFDFTAP